MTDRRSSGELTTVEATWVVCNHYLNELELIKHVKGNHAIWRCGECGKESLIAKLTSGDAGCVTEGCEVQAWMKPPRFVAYFDAEIDENDMRAASKQRKEILDGYVERKREEASIAESDEREKLKNRVKDLEGSESSLRGQLSSAKKDVNDLQGRLEEEISNREHWEQEAGDYQKDLQKVTHKLEARKLREGERAAFCVGSATLVLIGLWLTLFLERSGIVLGFWNLTLSIVISIGYAVLVGAGIYQSAKRAYTEDRVWEPFYDRIEVDRILQWMVKAGVVFGLPYIVAGWALEIEWLTSWVPPGETAWTLMSFVAAMILPVAYVAWAFRD